MTASRSCRSAAILATSILGFPVVPAVLAQASSAEPVSPPAAPMTIGVSWLNGFASGSQASGRDGVGARSEFRLDLGYVRRSRRTSFDISAGSVAPVQPGVAMSDALSHGLSVRVSSRLGRRTWLEASEHLSYAPLDLAGALSGSGQLGDSLPALDSTVGLGQGHARTATGAISVTRTLGRRSSASLSYTHSASLHDGGAGAANHMAAFRFNRRLSSFAALQAGYGHGRGHAASRGRSGPGGRQDFDLGIHYERPLPLAGRTTLAVNSGTTVLSDGRSRRLRLMVEGSLAHAMSAHWSARLEFRRPIQFLAGVSEAILSDTLSASVAGRTTRDTDVLIATGVSRGAVGLGATGRRFSSRSLSARFRARLARAWWLELHGFAAGYRFDSAESVSGALPAEFARRGVRAGVSWQVPLRRP